MNNQLSFITSIEDISSIEDRTINGSTDPRPPETVTWNPWHGSPDRSEAQEGRENIQHSTGTAGRASEEGRTGF